MQGLQISWCICTDLYISFHASIMIIALTLIIALQNHCNCYEENTKQSHNKCDEAIKRVYMTKSLCTECIPMVHVKCSHLSVPINYFAFKHAQGCYLVPALYFSIAEQKNTPCSYCVQKSGSFQLL